jgi:co-chaperonin GroES (HSP10)
MSNINPYKISSIKPLRDDVIIVDMEFGEQATKSGIIVRSDDGKTHGIKPRWGKVYAVGPKQQDVKIGQWVLVEHGRWTRGVNIEDVDGEKTIRKIDTNAMMMISDTPPENDVVIGTEI